MSKPFFKIQRAIMAISGLTGFLGAYLLASLINNPLIQLICGGFMIWGIYWFIKGTIEA